MLITDFIKSSANGIGTKSLLKVAQNLSLCPKLSIKKYKSYLLRNYTYAYDGKLSNIFIQRFILSKGSNREPYLNHLEATLQYIRISNSIVLSGPGT
jgi:hypothetical protein